MSDFREKLAEANKKAEAQKAERRARSVKGSHLTDKFVKMAQDASCQVGENTGFHVIQGLAGKSLRIYVAKRGGIVDLLGFTIDVPAVKQISREEAKAKHMGRVFGRFDLDRPDEEVLAAFGKALEALNVPQPEKPAKAPKKEAPAQSSPEPEITAQPSEPTDEEAASFGTAIQSDELTSDPHPQA